MKKLFSYIIIFISPIVLSHGQEKADKLKKIETEMIFEKKPSIISLPIEISISDLQKQINEGLPDLIYVDNSFDDNDKDQLKVKVWRNGDLIFTDNSKGTLTYEVPLRVWAQKEITVLGISQSPSTEFKIKIKFSTHFNIDKDYRLDTKTQGISYEWITRPVLKSGFLDIPIGSIIGRVITQNLPVFSAQIDETLKEGYPLKPYLIEAWNTAKQPFLVSEEYNTWVKADPVEVYMTPFESVGRIIKSTLGFKVFIETFVGTPKYKSEPVADIPSLRLVRSISDQFDLQLLNIISYEEANIISKRMFIGEVFEFKNGRYKITVTDLNIGNVGDLLNINVRTTGSFKGSLDITGKPVYDEDKGKVVLEDVKLDIKTRNILHKVASWLLNGTLEKNISEEFGLPVDEIIEYSKQSILEAVNSEISKGIFMQGQIISIKPDKVMVSDEGILALVNSKAKVRIIITGM